MKLKNSFREADPITVQRDYGFFRPNQPAVVHQTRCRWIIGDVTEVLDHNTWKLGKIAKIVKNDYFVIRLADCIQLKEFHLSSLRVPQPQDAPTPHTKQFSAADNKVSKQPVQFLEHANGSTFHLLNESPHSCFVKVLASSYSYLIVRDISGQTICIVCQYLEFFLASL